MVEQALWNMYKHLGERVDLLEVEALSNYISSILREPRSQLEIQKQVQAIKEYRAQLKRLQAMPKVAQRSEEWYQMRLNRLTASDTAQALGKGKFGTKQQLIAKKAYPDTQTPLSMNVPPLHWGVMFEPMVSRCYSQRHGDIIIHEFGLIPHPDIDFLGASPDGVTELGVMVEFKAPWKRKIDGVIPEQYELQMQSQMAVCGLQECDYVECDMASYKTLEEYAHAIPEHQTKDHGIIIENDFIFQYSPENSTPLQAIEWMEMNKLETSKIWFWSLRKINIARVLFDAKRWHEMVPELAQFWGEVQEARKVPLTEQPSKKKKYDFIDDD